MRPDDIVSLTELLKAYGPWALVVILLIAIAFLFLYLNKKIDCKDEAWQIRYDKQGQELGILLEKRNDQFIQVLQSTTSVLERCESELQDCKKALQECKSVSKEAHDAIIQFEILSQSCRQRN